MMHTYNSTDGRMIHTSVANEGLVLYMLYIGGDYSLHLDY